MADTVSIGNEHWRARVDPRHGGTVLDGRARVGDAWVDVLRPTAPEDESRPPEAASYALIPWSNRVRDGVLRWQGEDYQLRVNFPDGTAIHGTGMEFPWEVERADATSVVLGFDSRRFHGVNFPWAFTSRLAYTLDGPVWRWRMEVTNTDDAAFPAGVGHHPYFLRRLLDADGSSVGGEALLQVNAERGYALENCLPSGPAGDIPAHADFRARRPLGGDFVDDCLTGRSSPTVAVIEYPEALTVTIDADEVLSHVVVYVPVGERFFAVEPVSNANDGFTLLDAGVDSAGVVVLEPRQTLAAEFSLTAAAPS